MVLRENTLNIMKMGFRLQRMLHIMRKIKTGLSGSVPDRKSQGYFATAEEFNASQAAEAPGFEEFVTQSFENSLSGTVINAEAYSSPSTSELTTDLGAGKR